jgi:hypothetical protein
VDDTGAQQVFVLHRSGPFIRHLKQRGLEAYPATTLTRKKYQTLMEVTLPLFPSA